MTNCANVAATLHDHLCVHWFHGYTQGGGRWGDGDGVCSIAIDGRTYSVEQGDRDCSSSVIDCWCRALEGTPYEGALNGATYTGNMRSVFVGSGLFAWHPMGDGYIAQRGDVYLNERDHTAMCQTAVPDMLSEFCINELGGIVGGQVGDQTGNESHVRPYYDYPWDGILAYNGKADAAPARGPRQVAGNPVNDAGFLYRAHAAFLGWLDSVRDGQTAGTVGYGLRLEAIKITPPKGMELNVKFHVQNIGWRTYSGIKRGASSGTGSSDNDPIIGTVGESLQAEALEIEVTKNTTGKTLYYRVHLADVGWTGWVEAGYAAGTVGIGKQIEAVQFKLV